MVIERLGFFELRQVERLQDVAAVLVLLLRQAVDVDAGGGGMPVSERLLCFAQCKSLDNSMKFFTIFSEPLSLPGLFPPAIWRDLD